MRPLRVGAVPYLNIDPFLAALVRQTPCEVIRAHPSALRELWRAKNLDLCQLSAPDLFSERLDPLRHAAISSHGEVRSVLLMGKAPVAEWRRVALDPASRTSNQLARVLLRETLGVRPECAIFPDPGAAFRDGLCDAAVVIGDRALASQAAPVVLDLGKIWQEQTGLPFVYATWVRGKACRISLAALEELLWSACHESSRNIAACAEAGARRLALPQGLLEDYLCRNISYRFEAEEEAGLERYRELLGAPPSWAHGRRNEPSLGVQ